jgi:hypothetical protein
MIGPAIIPRMPPTTHRLPIRTLNPLNSGTTTIISLNTPLLNPINPPNPPSNPANPLAKPFTPKPKYQVQANAMNVPDAVRKSMAPPPTDLPETFKVPSLEQQKQALNKKKSLIPNRYARISKKSQSYIKQGRNLFFLIQKQLYERVAAIIY